LIVKGLRIGTRTSRLARAQTGIVIEMLRTKFPALEIEVVPVTTMGDRLPDEKRAEVEGKGAFTEDLEALLQKGEVDAAVHSMKDLPTKLGGGLAIAATPVRADPRDALVSSHGLSLAEMPEGAVVGTSSIRRKAQLMALRSDIELVDLHGNVETRLRRMGERGLDGIVLAAAGLRRLGEEGRITEYFSIEELVPAPCQGTIAVEIRAGDRGVGAAMKAIDDGDVRAVSTCERSFATRLGGDCDLPAGFCATKEGERMRLVGAILSPDGKSVVKETSFEDAARPDEVGRRFAEKMLEMGGEAILERVMR